MPPRRPKLPCCGPFAQKQKRLLEVEATVKRLSKIKEATPRTQTTLAKAQAEKRLLTGWLEAHTCAPPAVRIGRATRI